MPTPEPPKKAESDDVPVPDTEAESGNEARAADPWEQMPDDALNAAGVGTKRSGGRVDGPEGDEDAEDGAEANPRNDEAAPGAGTEDAGGGAPAKASSWTDFAPSPVFVLILGLAGFAGWLSWRAVELDWATDETAVTPLIPPLLILLGWIVSVAVHEFAHTLAAYLAGDRSLRGSGYIRFNPFAYREAFGGLVLPVLYLGLGGFGLNGPPTYVNWERIPSPARRVMVALAGPLASLLLSAALALTVTLLVPVGQDSVNWAISAMAFLAFANLTSALVNLLPVPGLDGYHVLAAFRDARWTTFAKVNGLFFSIGVFAVLWLPVVRDLFDSLIYTLFELILPNPTVPGMMFHGNLLLRFWS